MNYKIIFLFALVFAIACNTKESQVEMPITPSDTSQQERNFNDNTDFNNQKPAPIKGKRVTYKSCAVYAGATDYAFSDKDGELILIRVSNYAEEKEGPQTIIPDNMLESGDDLEGPPGANPALVGKGFILVYDELNEKVLKVLIDQE